MTHLTPDEAKGMTPEEILELYRQTGSIFIKNKEMLTLDELAIKYGTDKSSSGHNYCKYYDIFFGPLRNIGINLLEIGIDKGDSLKMWHEYFVVAEIHGIDIRSDYEYLIEWAAPPYTTDINRMNTHIVDHSNKADLIMFGEQYNQYFDIIIEDGSHQSADSILTFETLFPYLKPGGFYCIEDMLCDFDPRWNKGVSSLDRVRQMVGEVNMNGLVSNDAICANKIEAVKKYAGSYFENNIEYIFVSMGLCIIKKM